MVMRNSDEEPYDEYTITLVDDVSSWNIGDKLVIASTDYDMNQAEEVEILSIEGSLITVKGMFYYL